MEKKKLYESIMTAVAKTVKQALNENFNAQAVRRILDNLDLDEPLEEDAMIGDPKLVWDLCVENNITIVATGSLEFLNKYQHVIEQGSEWALVTNVIDDGVLCLFDFDVFEV